MAETKLIGSTVDNKLQYQKDKMIKKRFHSRVGPGKNSEAQKMKEKPIKNFYKMGEVVHTDKTTALKGIYP
jgi:hypothetical protein